MCQLDPADSRCCNSQDSVECLLGKPPEKRRSGKQQGAGVREKKEELRMRATIQVNKGWGFKGEGCEMQITGRDTF